MYRMVLHCCARAGDLELAEKYYAELQEHMSSSDLTFTIDDRGWFNKVIQDFGDGLDNPAADVLATVRSLRQPDAAPEKAAASGGAEETPEHHKSVVDVVAQQVAARPPAYSDLSRVSVCNHQGSLRFFDHMLEAGLPPATYSYAVVVHACAKAGERGKALSHFAELRSLFSEANREEFGLEAPSEQEVHDTYRVLTRAFLLLGEVDGAQSLLGELRAADALHSNGIYNDWIRSCVDQGDVNTALGYYVDMLDAGAAPNKLTHR